MIVIPPGINLSILRLLPFNNNESIRDIEIVIDCRAKCSSGFYLKVGSSLRKMFGFDF